MDEIEVYAYSNRSRTFFWTRELAVLFQPTTENKTSPEGSCWCHVIYSRPCFICFSIPKSLTWRIDIRG